MASWKTGTRLLGGCVAGLVLALTARAEPVQDLYSTERLVASQSAGERREAARQGLEELVVRVSGDVEAAEQPEVREALSRAEDFIYEYNYRSTDETLAVDGQEQPASRLILKFSPVELERLLRAANLSLWPSNRPGVLVWMVARDQDGLRRVSGSEERDALREQARHRGLPLAMPLDDLEDRLALSARQLWDLDEEAIRKASSRYNAEAILVGRYSETSGGQWQSDWQLYHNLDDVTFYVRADSVESLVGDVVNQAADHFADLYAIVPREEGPDTVILQVGGIDDFADFKAAERYLDELPMVRRTELVSVRTGVMTLRLMTDGEQSRLLASLERDQRLVPSADSHRVSLTANRYQAEGTQANPLVYTWQ